MKSKQTKAESELLKSYAKKYFNEIVFLMGIVPSDLLLLLKTLALLLLAIYHTQ